MEAIIIRGKGVRPFLYPKDIIEKIDIPIRAGAPELG